jgi:hypothetical protein
MPSALAACGESIAGLTFTDGHAIVPEGINAIPEDAFKFCSSLVTIAFPASLQIIGKEAFRYCMGLTAVDFPDSLVTIEESAFKGDNALTSVGFGNTKMTFGKSAFSGTGLTGPLTFNAGSAIGDDAFYDTGLTNVTFGDSDSLDSRTTIGEYAFAACASLKTLNFGSSVASIGEWAFSRCSNLTGQLTFGANISIGDYAFYECSTALSSLSFVGHESVDSGDSVTTLGRDAFQSCTGLTTVHANLKSIGNNAFKSLTGLTALSFGRSLTTIGNNAFEGCTGLKGGIIFSDSVVSIGQYSFRSCTGLTSLTVGDSDTRNSQTSIGQYAFHGCTGLTDLRLHSVRIISSHAFEYCLLNGSVGLGANTSSIGWGAFKHTNISGVLDLYDLPYLKSVSTEAFEDTRLTKVTFPSSLTHLASYAFSDIPTLTHACGIPERLKGIRLIFTYTPPLLGHFNYYLDAEEKALKPCATTLAPSVAPTFASIHCGAGKHRSATEIMCEDCPAGRFTTTFTGELKEQKCQECPCGRISAAGSSECAGSCPDGMYSNGAICVPCSGGARCPGGMRSTCTRSE